MGRYRFLWRKGLEQGKPALEQLVSQLNIKVLPERRGYPNPEGLTGRLKKMRKVVTALVKHERLEVRYFKGDEARGYAERLISDAIRYGDCHRPTMDQAKFWIEDEAAIPKLFKVLVPRYKDWPSGLPYTRMLRAPADFKNLEDRLDRFNYPAEMAVLELRGNPFPPLPGPFAKPHPGALHNVLLEEARKEYFRTQSQLERQAEQQTNAIPVPGESSVHPSEIDDGSREDSSTSPAQPEK